MDNFVSRKRKANEDADGSFEYENVQVKEMIHPKTKNIPATDTFVIFQDTKGREFKGNVPQLTADACYFAWKFKLRAVPKQEVYKGKSKTKFEIKSIVSCERDQLTGKLFLQLMLEVFRNSYTHNEILNKWKDSLNWFVQYGYASALLDTDDKDMLFSDFLDKPRPQVDFEFTPFSVNERLLNTQVLASLNATTGKVVSSSAYFLYTGGIEDVLKTALGNKYRALYPKDLINQIISILHHNPISLFFKSKCPGRIEVFHSKALPVVKQHTLANISQTDIAKVKTYENFYGTLEYSFSHSTCFPVYTEKFSYNQEILNSMIQEEILSLEDAPDPANAAHTIKFIQDSYSAKGEQIFAKQLFAIADEKLDIDPEMVASHLRTGVGVFGGMDESQQLAVKRLTSTYVGMVNAPPGTGKSKTLLSLACWLAVFCNLKVLIVTPTNSSLENLLANVGKTMKQTSTDFYPNYKKQVKSWNNPMTDFDILINEISSLETGTVVIRSIQSVTYESLVVSNGNKKLKYIDVCIFDEASMLGMEEPRLLLQAVPRIKKLFIFGDIEQNPAVKEGRMQKEVCKFMLDYPVPGWSYNELKKLWRVDPASVLISENLKRILKREALQNVCADFSTAWMHYGCGTYKPIKDLVEKQRTRMNWSIEQTLSNILVIAYNHDDVKPLNELVFNLCFPGKQTGFGMFYKGEKIVFKTKQNVGNTMIYNNTILLIKNIEVIENEKITRKEFKAYLNASAADRAIFERENSWISVESTNIKSWWKTRLTFTNGDKVNMFTIDPEYVQQAYAQTSTALQGKEAHTVFVYETNDPKHVDGPRPKEDLYTSTSRAKCQVVIFGNMILLDNLLNRPDTESYSMLGHHLRKTYETKNLNQHL